MTRPWNLLADACTASKEAVLAAPYLKIAALERLLAQLDPSARLTCVTRWTPQDVVLGASDVDCRNAVFERGGEFRLHPNLHAKYYRCGGNVLVGSANLTANGIGLEGLGNLEILCEPDQAFDSEAFERELIRDSNTVSDQDFARWAEIASLPAQALPPNSHPDDPAGWVPTTRDPEHVWLAYNEMADHIPSADQQRLADLDLGSLSIPPGLERPAFEIWIRGALLASVAVAAVRQVADLSESDAWEHLASTWSISRAESARRQETVEYWIAAFLDR
jgi:hypothetical protein